MKSMFLRSRRNSCICFALLFLAVLPVYSQAPYVATQAAGPVGDTSATLNGMATARGNPTAAWFEWGPDTNYGLATALTNVGSSVNVARVSASVAGLITGGVYHYRLVVSNAFGVVFGADAMLTTGKKISTWSDTAIPTITAGLSNIVQIASGHEHSLAIRSDGTVVAWFATFPFFNAGQTNVPVGLTNIVAVAGGLNHSLALKQDGTVIGFGYNFYNQTNVPATLTNVIAIAAGDSHSLALKGDGKVVSWGLQNSVPAGLSNVVAIAAGSTHSLALKADGKVTAWGSSFGSDPTPPASLSNVVAISTETWHNLALRVDGTVVGWGYNFFGEANVPVGLSNVVAIAAGWHHSLALKSDGTLVAWGNSGYVTNVPPGLNNVVAITSGDHHSVALSPVNLQPRMFGRTVTGPMNTEFSISLSSIAWDPNGDSLSFRIESLSTNGTLYQYTAGGRGALISEPGTPNDPTRVIFAPQLEGFGAPYDSFSITANDGEYDSQLGLVTINIVPRPVVQSQGLSSGTNKGFALNFTGLSNATYGVQASTNLMNWSRVGNASQPSPGQFFFLDADATNRAYRFYRLVSP